MYYKQVKETLYINVRQIQQDEINGLGCLYGGSFNWGNETFTLSEPKENKTYECEILVQFGGRNGSGGLYNVEIYVKYDADNPNSPWQHVTTLQNVRGCTVEFPGRNSSSLYTQVKVKWFSGGILKDSIVSAMFKYIYHPVRCKEADPRSFTSSRCGYKNFDILDFSIPNDFQKIEVFDITGRRIFTKGKIYVKKVTLMEK